MDKFVIRDLSRNTVPATISAPVPSVATVATDSGSEPEEETYNDSHEGVLLKRKKRIRNVFKQKFKKSWITKDNKKWLTEIPATGQAQCNVCNKTLVGGITHINRHGNSRSHIKKIKCLGATPQIATLMTETTEKKRLKDGVKQAEIKMIMFLAEHNLPFRLLEHLPKFLASVCYDSEIAKHLQCSRKKAESLYTATKGLLEQNNIPLTKMIGFAADNASICLLWDVCAIL
ncbi:hypothetical protein TcasGA2_TC033294 [Tribolium castaneum]|uniref:Uncharacterized protein n=1 Tax=Tribolium castaneum TaxID=7070 RepID=A0A139W9R3_TRICA|nr:hypothetical protein TcasGA2_TC033294 [Tribolium castaneum]